MDKKRVKYLVMDVDGILTDGKIYMGDDGEAMKAFNVKDGYGIHDIAVPAGIEPIIITGRTSKILEKRCKEIGIRLVYQGVGNKVEKLRSVIEDYSTVAYIGDDINDLRCMFIVKDAGGIVGCPKDAVKKVLMIADYVTEHDGGDGAVRDFIDWLTSDVD